jgi:hypothetical protein
MAIRTPLKLDGSNIKEMSSAEITQIKNRCAYLYGGNPSVTVSRVAANTGNLTPRTDTAVQAGSTGQRADRFPNVGELAGVSQYTNQTYDNLSTTVGSNSQDADTANIRNFCYLNGSNNIVAFSNTDMYDTFYDDVIDDLTASGDVQGTFVIGAEGASTRSGCTRVDGTAIFANTLAGTIGFGSNRNAVSEGAQFLFQVNQSAAPSMTLPIRIRSASDAELRQINQTDVDTLLGNDIRYWATQKIRYSIDTNNNGTGQQRGSAMIDERRTGSTRITQFVDANNYQARMIPSGGDADINVYRLKIRKI